MTCPRLNSRPGSVHSAWVLELHSPCGYQNFLLQDGTNRRIFEENCVQSFPPNLTESEQCLFRLARNMAPHSVWGGDGHPAMQNTRVKSHKRGSALKQCTQSSCGSSQAVYVLACTFMTRCTKQIWKISSGRRTKVRGVKPHMVSTGRKGPHEDNEVFGEIISRHWGGAQGSTSGAPLPLCENSTVFLPDSAVFLRIPCFLVKMAKMIRWSNNEKGEATAGLFSRFCSSTCGHACWSLFCNDVIPWTTPTVRLAHKKKWSWCRNAFLVNSESFVQMKYSCYPAFAACNFEWAQTKVKCEASHGLPGGAVFNLAISNGIWLGRKCCCRRRGRKGTEILYLWTGKGIDLVAVSTKISAQVLGLSCFPNTGRAHFSHFTHQK